MELNLILPQPPTVNHYWGQSGKLRFLTAKAKTFRKEVAIRAQLAGKSFGKARLGIRIVYFPADKRRTDLDNRLKGLLDALQHASVFDDDEQIDQLTIIRGAVQVGGACSVLIWNLVQP